MGDTWEGLGPGTPAVGGGRGGAGLSPTRRWIPLAWPAADSLLAAFERGEPAEIRSSLEKFAAAAEPLAEAAPCAAAIFLYDVLRTIAETTEGGGGLPEQERLRLITRIGATPDAPTLVRAFAEEAERWLAPVMSGGVRRRPAALRARRFIDEHAAEKISLARVAREIGVTRTYLSALFRREYGMTLTEYIHQVRIDRAETMLRDGALPLTEIAVRSGYGSYRHFHRSFTKLRRESPRVFQTQVALRGGAPPPPGALGQSALPAD